MKKDVIYVDIEDDITAIIGKVKSSSAKIVALVPPKRIGALQSVVNLKLLQRAAESAGKRVVLISNNSALTSLAAGVAMPVAKNLQTKPEVPEVPAISVDDEDIINGEELPVGELASTSPNSPAGSSDLSSENAALSAVISSEQAAATKPPAKTPFRKKSKIPDFDSFRKKLFIFGGLGILLVAFLVWAIFFAPRATVAVTARTSAVNIDKILTGTSDAPLDAKQNVLPFVSKQTKKTQSSEFTATGKKEVGERAKGQVTLTNETLASQTIPAGTVFIAEGKRFTSDSRVTLGPPSVCEGFSVCKDSKEVGVTASDIGEDYNIPGPASFATDASVSAQSESGTSGGSSKQVTVVSQADVDRARDDLKGQDAEKVKADLAAEFGDGVVIVEESFSVSTGNLSISPSVGQEATKAQVAVETTYSLYAFKRDDLKAVFDEYLRSQMSDENSQKIYASGDENLQFSSFDKKDDGFEVRVQATGQVGPQIDEAALKQQVSGKRAGEIREHVETIEGVQNVETNFWPFWVNTAPGSDKITIKFLIEND